MSSSFEVVHQDVAQQFVIDANPNFDFIYRQDDTYPLANLAQQISYRSIGSDGNNSSQLSFKIDVSSNFLERDIWVNISGIPLTLERSAAVPATEKDGTGADVPLLINEDNFVTKFFGNYSDFAYKQHSIGNCVELISMKLDNIDLETRGGDRALKLTSHYADPSIVYEKIDHSMPDLMAYNKYKTGTTPIKTKGIGGNVVSIVPSVISASNPFGTMGDLRYNSRQPVFSFDGWDSTGRKKINVTTDELCLQLPFTSFSIPGEDAPPFIGTKKLLVNITFKNEWFKHLFCSTKGFDTSIVKVEMNRLKDTNLKGRIAARMFTEPSYIQNGYLLNNNFVPNYNFAYQKVDYLTEANLVKISNATTVTSLNFNMNSIPRAIYIGAKLHPKTTDDVISTADVFARIRGLTVEMDGVTTTLAQNANDVYQMAKRNGLNLPKECNYLCGFPLKLDVSNDLAGPQLSLVGSAARNLNSFRVVSLDLENVDNYLIEQEYEIQVVFVYDSLISYSQGNFKKYETLINLARELSIELHAENLYNNQISKVNIVGGNFIGFLAKNAPLIKRIGKGVWNLARDKEFRNKISNAFSEKKKENNTEWNKPTETPAATTTGGYFSRRTPALGGGYANNVTGGQNMSRFTY